MDRFQVQEALMLARLYLKKIGVAPDLVDATPTAQTLQAHEVAKRQQVATLTKAKRDADRAKLKKPGQ